MRTPQKNTKTRKRADRKLYVIVMVALTFAFSSFIVSYLGKYERLRLEELEIKKEIDAEIEKGQTLHDELEFNQSDAFVEEFARERLNLVMPDEILFQNDEK